MTEAPGAAGGECVASQVGYRSGAYPRTPVMRVAKMELRVPPGRMGQFSTDGFERCQRSDQALREMLVEAVRQRWCDHFLRNSSPRRPELCPSGPGTSPSTTL